MHGLLKQRFPRLTAKNYKVTSPPTEEYNCIAWAAGDDERWWWPSIAYWPEHAPNEVTVAAFIAAFEGLGYSVCLSGDLEAGFEKVALYVDKDNSPTHMAKQLEDGAWTSKLGNEWDISHTTPAAISGQIYGSVSTFLRRAKRQPET